MKSVWICYNTIFHGCIAVIGYTCTISKINALGFVKFGIIDEQVPLIINGSSIRKQTWCGQCSIVFKIGIEYFQLSKIAYCPSINVLVNSIIVQDTVYELTIINDNISLLNVQCSPINTILVGNGVWNRRFICIHKLDILKGYFHIVGNYKNVILSLTVENRIAWTDKS